MRNLDKHLQKAILPFQMSCLIKAKRGRISHPHLQKRPLTTFALLSALLISLAFETVNSCHRLSSIARNNRAFRDLHGESTAVSITFHLLPHHHSHQCCCTCSRLQQLVVWTGGLISFWVLFLLSDTYPSVYRTVLVSSYVMCYSLFVGRAQGLQISPLAKFNDQTACLIHTAKTTG